ncbi:MAG: DUF4276 family protein [Polyangiaceae bacterium]|nr:DUF4276 family protein [Polyangiaceae bacterium]
MRVHALVEGPSEQALLEPWARRLLRGHELKAYPHQGKGRLAFSPPRRPDPRQRGLLDQLPAKLAAFGAALDRAHDRVLVLIDADNDDLTLLKRRLDALHRALHPAPVVLFRFAVEELEAFYLADLKALKAAFPDYDRRTAREYVPDSICGTWELFGTIIGDGSGDKVAWAQAMAKVLTTRAEESRSASFQALCRGLRELVTPDAAPLPRKRKPRRAKFAVRRDATGKRQW